MRLLDRVLERDELADLDPAARRLALRAIVCESRPETPGPWVAELADAVDGFGPIASLMRDDRITDVLINGPREVWIEKDGNLERSDACFDAADDLYAFIERWVAVGGGRADASEPISDARLPDGSRMHVVLPPIAPRGPLVSIRRFPRTALTLDDLVAAGMLGDDEATLLAGAVGGRRTIAISGATGSGKTTLMGALLGLIGGSERVVIVEETPELRPACPHAVSLVARRPNVEGRGTVALEELVRAALRMRPDRIVVGEVRGGEALAALTAMSTGHRGSMVTVHARCPADLVSRLVMLALQATSAPGEDMLKGLFGAAFDLVVHLERVAGARRVAAITEVSGM